MGEEECKYYVNKKRKLQVSMFTVGLRVRQTTPTRILRKSLHRDQQAGSIPASLNTLTKSLRGWEGGKERGEVQICTRLWHLWLLGISKAINIADSRSLDSTNQPTSIHLITTFYDFPAIINLLIPLTCWICVFSICNPKWVAVPGQMSNAPLWCSGPSKKNTSGLVFRVRTQDNWWCSKSTNY